MSGEEEVAEVASVCRCDCAYVGAQAAGTPTRCEQCGGLVDDVAGARMDAVYAESLARLKALDERECPTDPTPGATA